MSTVIQPYLFFGGRCEEALEFYTAAIGAKVGMKMRFSDSPHPMPEGMLAPGFEGKIMHSDFCVAGNTILASDGCREGDGGFHAVSLVYSSENEAVVRRAFDALGRGGEVTMPLDKTFWSPCYGMLKDKFGMHWQLMVPGNAP